MNVNFILYNFTAQASKEREQIGHLVRAIAAQPSLVKTGFFVNVSPSGCRRFFKIHPLGE